MTVEKLALKDFRRRVVAGSFPRYPGLAEAMVDLEFVQADPIRSPARAQDLMLRQRVADYAAGDLEREFPNLDLEEGFLFAYGFMRSDIWQALHGTPGGALNQLERQVLKAVAERGEGHPRRLSEPFGKRSVTNAWGGKSQEIKRVLDDLHDRGHLRVGRREKGQRVYQLPKERGEKASGNVERYARLVITTAHVFGPTTRSFLMSELGYLKHIVPKRSDREGIVDQLITSGKLVEVEVEGTVYLWIRDEWQCEEVPERVRIVAPFDPLVRDRQRFEQIWGWAYRFEAYVPAAKRKRGYYAMPLLWRDRVIGWANARVNANAKGDRLEVEIGYVGKPPREKAFRLCLGEEIEAMASFLGIHQWQVSPGKHTISRQESE